MREHPVEVEVSGQKVLVLRQQIGPVEIRQARHFLVSSPRISIG
jgi:hypothetical protein